MGILSKKRGSENHNFWLFLTLKHPMSGQCDKRIDKSQQIRTILGSAGPVLGRKFRKCKTTIGRRWLIGKFVKSRSNEVLKL